VATEKHSPKSLQHSTNHSGSVDSTKADRSAWLNKDDIKKFSEHKFMVDYQKWFDRWRKSGGK